MGELQTWYGKWIDLLKLLTMLPNGQPTQSALRETEFPIPSRVGGIEMEPFSWTISFIVKTIATNEDITLNMLQKDCDSAYFILLQANLTVRIIFSRYIHYSGKTWNFNAIYFLTLAILQSGLS